MTYAEVHYICRKHKVDSLEPGFCNRCGDALQAINVGVICDCGAKYILKTRFCGNCGRRLYAEHWAHGAYGAKLGLRGHTWSSIELFKTDWAV